MDGELPPMGGFWSKDSKSDNYPGTNQNLSDSEMETDSESSYQEIITQAVVHSPEVMDTDNDSQASNPIASSPEESEGISVSEQNSRGVIIGAQPRGRVKDSSSPEESVGSEARNGSTTSEESGSVDQTGENVGQAGSRPRRKDVMMQKQSRSSGESAGNRPAASPSGRPAQRVAVDDSGINMDPFSVNRHEIRPQNSPGDRMNRQTADVQSPQAGLSHYFTPTPELFRLSYQHGPSPEAYYTAPQSPWFSPWPGPRYDNANIIQTSLGPAYLMQTPPSAAVAHPLSERASVAGSRPMDMERPVHAERQPSQSVAVLAGEDRQAVQSQRVESRRQRVASKSPPACRRRSPTPGYTTASSRSPSPELSRRRSTSAARRAAHGRRSSPTPPPVRRRRSPSPDYRSARSRSPSKDECSRKSSSPPPVRRRRSLSPDSKDSDRSSPTTAKRAQRSPSSDRKTYDHRSASTSVSQSSTSLKSTTLSRSPSPSPSTARRRSALRSSVLDEADRKLSRREEKLDETLLMKTGDDKQVSRSRKSKENSAPDQAGEGRRSPSTSRRRSKKASSESEDDEKARQTVSSSQAQRRRATILAGEKAQVPSTRRRPTPHPSFTDSGGSDEEKNPTSSAEQKKSSITAKRRADTPWRGSGSDPKDRTLLGSQKSSKNTVTFADLSVDTDDDDDEELPASQARRQIKPPVFTGKGNFETFLAHFVNCAKYNRWNTAEQLAHLRNCLSEEAGQVLWDSGPDVINSLSRLTKLLKERFGGAAQSDRYRMELRSRLRQPKETLSDLHRDIKRLIALGYPELDAAAREVIAIDRFLDSLGDSDLALKIRERTPTTLDEALKAGLRQEVWNKDASRRQPDNAPGKAVRVASEDLLQTVNQKLDQLQKQMDQANRRQPKPIVVTTVERLPANSPMFPPEVKPTPAPANTPVSHPTPEPAAATPTKPSPSTTISQIRIKANWCMLELWSFRSSASCLHE